MIRLPFGLAIVNARLFDMAVDHAAALLAERCRLIVERDQAAAVICVQQRTLRAQDAELATLRAAVADADRLLGLGD